MTPSNEPGKQDQTPQPQPAIPNQYSFLWLSAAIFLMFLWLQGNNQQQQQELAYSEFKQAVISGQVAEVTLRTEEISGSHTDSGVSRFANDSRPPSSSFITLRPQVKDSELIPLL